MKAEAEADGPAGGSLVAELGDDHPEEAAAEAAGRAGCPRLRRRTAAWLVGGWRTLCRRFGPWMCGRRGRWPPPGPGAGQAHCRVLAVREVPRSWSTGRGSAAGAAVSPVATAVFVATKFVQGRWLLL
jgi:hypothetical protein